MPDPIRTPAGLTHRSHSRWGVELGGLRLAVTRTRETLSPAAPPVPRATSRTRPFTAGALAGVGGVALLVVGASAAPRLAMPDRYLVSVPVPEMRKQVVRPAARAPVPGRLPRAKGAATTATGERFDAADEAYVARALTTGAFQEWEGADGLPRFLTAGPARVANGRACRDLALLVRLADGGSHVRAAERCTTAPVSDEPMPTASDDTVD